MIVGSICMDQMMIRFDELVNIDDEVILIGDDPKISVYQRASQASTIIQEIYTQFTNRLPRIYYEDNKIIKINNGLLNK